MVESSAHLLLRRLFSSRTAPVEQKVRPQPADSSDRADDRTIAGGGQYDVSDFRVAAGGVWRTLFADGRGPFHAARKTLRNEHETWVPMPRQPRRRRTRRASHSPAFLPRALVATHVASIATERCDCSAISAAGAVLTGNW